MNYPILFIALLVGCLSLPACLATQEVKTTQSTATQKSTTTDEKAAKASTETVEKGVAKETTEKTEAVNLKDETAKAETETAVAEVKNEVAKTAENAVEIPQIGETETYTKIAAVYADMNHPQELGKFLNTLKTNVEAHKWGPVFGQCSPMHYKTQIMTSKIAPPQYIAEILGLHSEGNSIKEGKKLGYEDLKRIKTLSYDTVDFDGKMITVTGNTTLQDDTELKINLLIEIIDNKYRLTGAVG